MNDAEPLAELLHEASRQVRAGRLAEARAIYHRALVENPQSIDALDSLAQLEFQTGHADVAAKLLRQAVSISPDSAHLHANLANTLAAQRQFDEAIPLYRRALALKPDSPQVLMNLAAALKNQGSIDEATSVYRQAIALYPENADAYFKLAAVLKDKGDLPAAIEALNRAAVLRPDFSPATEQLAYTLHQAGRLQEAVVAYRRLIELCPDSREAYTYLGVALYDLGQFDEAIEAHRQSVRVRPDCAEAYDNLGAVLMIRGRRDEAVFQLQQAVALRPDYVQAWDHLQIGLRDRGDLDEAIAAGRRAISLNPNYMAAYRNLGGSFRDAAELDEAIACYRKAISTGQDPEAHSDLLISMLLHPKFSPEEIWEEHARWNELYAKPLAPAQPRFQNDLSPDRRLRIGYVSPDFNQHPVGRLLLPLLTHHDHAQFEIFCYADVRRPDATTTQLQSNADQWRDTLRLSDEQLVQLIRQDRIDILVDLAMHTKNNRLLAFTRKPAPVQVTYLAYPGTTGIKAIDYRLTDPFLDPPDKGDIPNIAKNRNVPFTSEATVRLPRTFWNYSIPPEAAPVNELPALTYQRVTFGCLNLYCKVTPPMLRLWAQILLRVPRSRLLIHAPRGAHRERAREHFNSVGINASRVEFVDRQTPREYFHRYQQIDIALDTSPYPGGATTCDALWMGVPVVTIASRTALSRGGASILCNVGLPELVAHSEQGYLQIATALAGDLLRLSELRKSIRHRMRSSPLMDPVQFAHDVEAAFRQMWITFADANRSGV